MIHCTCRVDTAFIENLILHVIIPEKGSLSLNRKLTMDVLFFMSQMISAEVRIVSFVSLMFMLCTLKLNSCMT